MTAPTSAHSAQPFVLKLFTPLEYSIDGRFHYTPKRMALQKSASHSSLARTACRRAAQRAFRIQMLGRRIS